MKNILRLKTRGYLTETQVLTASRFFKNPNSFNLTPSVFRILREIIIDEVPLETLEERRGWTARSAKTVLSILLFSLEEAEGMFWHHSDEQQEEYLMHYLHDEDGEEVAALMDKFKLSHTEGKLFAILNRRFGKAVTYETIQRSLYPSDEPDSVAKTIKVFTSTLRAKIETHGLRLRAIRGVGLILESYEYCSDPDIEAWRKLRADGLSYERIAQKYGCTRAVVFHALRQTASEPAMRQAHGSDA